MLEFDQKLTKINKCDYISENLNGEKRERNEPV